MVTTNNNPVTSSGSDPVGVVPLAPASDPATGGVPAGQATYGASSPESNARASLVSAQAAWRLSDFQTVREAATRSIQEFPGNPTAYVLRAQANNRLGDYASAERDARTALQYSPSNSLAFQALAWAQLRRHDPKQALDSIDRAIEIDPKSALAHAIRAYIEEARGDRKSLLEDIRRAAQLDPAYDRQVQLAKAGHLIDDLGGEDAGLLARHAEVEETNLWVRFPWERLLELLLFLAALIATAWFLRDRRRRTGSWRIALTPLRPPLTVPSPVSGQPGDWIGKYELGRVIGRGGMGVVYEATDHSLGRKVAIKKMSDTVAGLGEGKRQKFIQEARTVASLHHDGIVDIYDILEQDANVYLVFEFVEGRTAHELLTAEGRMSLPKSLSILRPVCEALEFAHSKHLAHRDLKPMNIMVREDGRAKLMDFGIARIVTDADGKPDRAHTQTVLGTPVYMAPECWTGVVRRESDIYSLGVTLYELLTGALPFKNPITDAAAGRFDLASSLVAGLPPAVDELLAKALEPDPDKRIASAKEFLRHLQITSPAKQITPV